MTRIGSVRDIRALATRAHRRWLEYRRRYPGMSVPISDTLSRILEHDPDYRPLRPRSPSRQRPPLQNPGVFTLKEVADALETTVGDLLGEPGYVSIRDLVSREERRKLRDAVVLLRDFFDLDDESLIDADPAPFVLPPAEFLARDYDYPAPYDVDPARMRVVRVIGDAMAPELRDGWQVAVDTERTAPEENDMVAVYLRGRGGVLGRWQIEGTTPILRRSNPAAPPIPLIDDDWLLWGTVTRVVDAPID